MAAAHVLTTLLLTMPSARLARGAWRTAALTRAPVRAPAAARLAALAAGGGARTALDEVGAKGEFKRTPGAFRELVSPGGRHPPEAGRYHLHLALACPWANGVLSALYLKGLEHAISYSLAHPTWQRTRPDDPSDAHVGWVYRAPGDAALASPAGHGAFECDEALVPDTVGGCASVRDAYDKYGGDGARGAAKFTTPLLVDTATGEAVNNESEEILRMLDGAFGGLGAPAAPRLFPPERDAELAELHEWVYSDVLNGVYKCGFARTQTAYEEAEGALQRGLERLDGMLGARRFLGGDALCWVDLRLFHTLARFESVYMTHFKANRRPLTHFIHLADYTRDVYQSHEAVRRSFNLRHVKVHYFSSHPGLNPYAVVPAADGFDLDAPHGRAGLSGR